LGQEGVLSARYLKKENIGFLRLGPARVLREDPEGTGGRYCAGRDFPDHYAYEGKDLEQLKEKALRAGAEAMVTTERIWCGSKISPGTMPLWALSVRHVFPGEDLIRFETFLERLGQRA
jgi:tetraacyldisaccharide-1-P 4'-kinase